MRAEATRRPRRVLAGLLLCALLAGCGGSDEPDPIEPGTVALRNETDQGMAPQNVVAFFMQPAGGTDPGSNRLPAPIPPGGVVIVGLFPPGLYDAVALLDGGANVTWLDLAVVSGQPTNLSVPGPAP